MKYDAPYTLRKLQVSWQRTPASGVVQDAAVCTHHFINITDGVPDDTWTTDDYTTIENAYDTFWGAIKSYYNGQIKLAEYLWRPDGPAYRPHTPKPAGLLSPTFRRTSRAVVGTYVGQDLPPQVALSVTEVTPASYTVEDVEGVGAQIRNRWGRFYLPAPATNTMFQGWVDSAFAEAVATAVQTFYDTCAAAQLVPVMYSPTTGSAWSITDIHVDDIWDVIRSRRFTTPNSRHSKTITLGGL